MVEVNSAPSSRMSVRKSVPSTSKTSSFISPSSRSGPNDTESSFKIFLKIAWQSHSNPFAVQNRNKALFLPPIQILRLILSQCGRQAQCWGRRLEPLKRFRWCFEENGSSDLPYDP